jgi:intracellular multiplication protein IcmL
MATETPDNPTPETIEPTPTPVEQVVLKRALWANTFRVLSAAAIGGWVVAAILGFTVFRLAERPTPGRYFEAIHGQLIQAVPTNHPLLTSGAVLTGAQEALESGFNMNFHDYRMRIEHAAKWFTAAGFKAYHEALFNSGNMKTLERKRLFMSIAITGAPVIVQQGVLQGTHLYAWKIQIPVKVIFESSGYENAERHLATLILVRQNNVQIPRGWAVNSIVFGPMPQQQ